MKVVLLAVFMLETLKLSRDDFNVKYKNGNLPFLPFLYLTIKTAIRSRCLMWEGAYCVTVVSFAEWESALGDNNKTKAAKETPMIAVLYEIYLRGCRSFLSLMTFYSI